MVTRQFTYRFEGLPIFRLPGGGSAGMLSGEALISFDEKDRGFQIVSIWLHNGSINAPLVGLVRDYGEEACGPFELVHDAILVEREEVIGDLIDTMIDGGNAA